MGVCFTNKRFWGKSFLSGTPSSQLEYERIEDSSTPEK